MDRIEEIRRRYGLTISNVFHAGDGNLHPNISFDRRDPDMAHGCTSPAGRSWPRAWTPAAASPESTAWARTRSTTCPGSSTPRPSPPCARCVAPSTRRSGPIPARSFHSTPAASGGPRRVRRSATSSSAGSARCSARAASSATRRRSPSHTRLRRLALAGLPAGARGRLEDPGRGPRRAWLAPDAPADLAVSTRALEQVVSVSPADLVATVQAGTPLEACAAAWPTRDVAGARSAGPAGAEPRLGRRDRDRGPAASRLRSGPRPRPRLHRRHRGRATGEGRRAGGEERRRLRPHQAPGRRVRRLRDHRRGTSAAPRAAPGRRHAARPRPSRHAHLRRPRHGRRRSSCRRARAALPALGAERRLGAGRAVRRHRRRGASGRAPARHLRRICPGTRSRPTGRAAFWGRRPRQPRRPDHPSPRRAARRHRRNDRSPGPRPRRRPRLRRRRRRA